VSALNISGCATFAGELILKLPQDYVVGAEFLVASFADGYCGPFPSSFSNVTAVVVGASIPDCRSKVTTSASYRETSLSVLLGDTNDECEAGEGNLSPLFSPGGGSTTAAIQQAGVSVAVIAGATAGVFSVVVGVILIVLFGLRRRIVPSLRIGTKFRAIRFAS
jgi:hypothetical protein